MVTYIKKNVPFKFVEFAEPLNPEEIFNIGTTWEDYNNGCFVLLEGERLAYREAHPEATVYEVWNLGVYPEPPVHVRTIEEARMDLRNKIHQYDGSDDVNAFLVNGNKFWFNVSERSNYTSSIKSARLLGESTIEVFLGNALVEIPCDNAEMMLAQIQRYADKCFIVTKNHLLAAENIETIEECDGYDYKSGYPEMLSYEIEF